MSKEDRQIEWKNSTVNDRIGFYNGKKLFKIWLHSFDGVYNLCYVFKKDSIGVNTYNTLESAKRGAERFLKRLQEAVK